MARPGPHGRSIAAWAAPPRFSARGARPAPTRLRAAAPSPHARAPFPGRCSPARRNRQRRAGSQSTHSRQRIAVAHRQRFRGAVHVSTSGVRPPRAYSSASRSTKADRPAFVAVQLHPAPLPVRPWRQAFEHQPFRRDGAELCERAVTVRAAIEKPGFHCSGDSGAIGVWLRRHLRFWCLPFGSMYQP